MTNLVLKKNGVVICPMSDVDILYSLRHKGMVSIYNGDYTELHGVTLSDGVKDGWRSLHMKGCGFIGDVFRDKLCLTGSTIDVYDSEKNIEIGTLREYRERFHP